MACPTCDHTMHGIGGQPKQFYCPRCGTLRTVNDYGDVQRIDDSTPLIIARIRRLLDVLPANLRETAWTLGVIEACTLAARTGETA